MKGFVTAHEEQGRYMLHSHIQLFLEELSMSLRKLMFSDDEETAKMARVEFLADVDEFMDSTYGVELVTDCPKEGCKNELGSSPKVENAPDTNTRIAKARHKGAFREMNAQLMHCPVCLETCSHQDLVENSLTQWRKGYKLPAIDENEVLQDDTKEVQWMSRARLDMVAYTHSYHMTCGCAHDLLLDTSLWKNQGTRDLLKQKKFDEHRWQHTSSCWKKGCVCRFGPLPWKPNETRSVIHEDKGLPGEKNTSIKWHSLRPNDLSLNVPPWMILNKRPMGCQYVNTHNKAIGDVLNCNTNVQIGDGSHVFYSTCYLSKSTQEEDKERQQRVHNAIIKLLIKREQEVLLSASPDEENDDNTFVDGLCAMLRGVNAATSRHVVSSPMGHLITMLDGSRFEYSHEFVNLLVSQLDATLEGRPVDARIRTNKGRSGKKILWPDSSADDYIHRPNHRDTNGLCSHAYFSKYQKQCKTFKEMNHKSQTSNCVSSNSNGFENNNKNKGCVNDDDLPQVQNEEAKLVFAASHPGQEFSHLRRRKLEVIPVLNIQKGSLCSIEDLNLNSDAVSNEDNEKRESYAKMALLMFHPFRNKEDIQIEGSYWNKFNDERIKWGNKEETTFLTEGFSILQNIDDRSTSSSKAQRARDPVTLQKPLKDFDLLEDDNDNYCLEEKDMKEKEYDAPDLWR